MKLLGALGVLGVWVCVAQRAPEIGAPARRVSPEIVRQMREQAKTENKTGFTVAEIEEFKRLHDADAKLFHEIVTNAAANAKKYEDLENFINQLDAAKFNAALLGMAADLRSVKDFQDQQRRREEEELRTRKADHDLLRTQAWGVFMLMLSTVLSFVAAWWKAKHWDPDRRQAAAAKIAQAADERTEKVIAHVQGVERKVTEVKTLVDRMRNVRDAQEFIDRNRRQGGGGV